MARPRRPSNAICCEPLPEEIWDMIVAHADHMSRTALRLTCASLARISSAYIFRTVHLTIQRDSIERMIRLAFCETLRCHVKELVVHECPQLVKFKTLKDWERHIDCHYELGRKPEYREREYSSLPLHARPMREQRRLYREYEADRRSMEDFVLCMRRRVECSPEPRDGVYEVPPREDNPMQYAADHFYTALANFPNLQSVTQKAQEHHGDYHFWHELLFDTYRTRKGQSLYHNDVEDALPISFVLHALGWSTSCNKNQLKALNLHTSGTAFWSPDRIWSPDALWAPDRAATRLWGRLGKRQLDLDGGNANVYGDHELMVKSFQNLTSLTCKVEVLQDEVRDFVRYFGCFLGAAAKLEHLDLTLTKPGRGAVIGQDGDLLSPYRDSQKPFSSKLRELRLEIGTTGTSLVHFLSLVAPSLRTLTMENCFLLDPEESWPEILTRARDILTLDKVHIVDLYDADTETRSEPRGYMCDWMLPAEIFADFLALVKDYMLKKTNTKPDWHHAEAIAKLHLGDCWECYGNGSVHLAHLCGQI